MQEVTNKCKFGFVHIWNSHDGLSQQLYTDDRFQITVVATGTRCWYIAESINPAIFVDRFRRKDLV
jgi:hypothetical protein